MALTLDQFGNLGLSTGQKNKLQASADIGQALRAARNASQPPSSVDTSAVTLAQAKAIENFIRDVNTLLGPMMEAAKYIRQKNMVDAAQTSDDATPPGAL